MSDSKLIVDGFLKFLKDSKKEQLLPEIVSLLAPLARNQKQEVRVQSAIPLSPAEKKEVTFYIEQNYETAGEIIFETDKNILGGMKIMIGDTLIDLSTKTELQQLIQQI